MNLSRRFLPRLVRWTSLCVCFALVLTSLAVLPFTSVTGKSRTNRGSSPTVREGAESARNGQGIVQQPRVNAPLPLAGPPPGIVPNLDDMRRASEQERRHGGRKVHAPDPVPSTQRRWKHGSQGAAVRDQRLEVSRTNSAVKAHHARSTRWLLRAVLYPQGTDDMAMARIDPHNRTGTGGVDPLSNNFNWSLGLLGLKGRGLDLGLSLSYNSLATWTKSSSNWIDFDMDQSSPSPGFRLGFPVVQGPYYHNLAATYFYILITPSGQRVELRQISASVFQAVDASYSQLTVYSGYLIYRAQGAQLKFYPNPANTEYHCTELKDRNGNYLTVAYNGVGEIATVTDTLGRVVTFNYDGNNNIQTITQPWNGATHTWASFGWGTTPIGNNFPSLYYVGPTPGTSIQVITQVGLPDGSIYYFDYDGSYGVVTKVRYYAQSGNERWQTTYTFNFTNSDSPRVTAERDWAASWNGDTDEVPASGEEAVTTYAHDGDGGCRVTFPDGTVDKEYYGTGWQSGLSTETRSFANATDADNYYWKKRTTTAWTQENPNVSYPLNPRVTETNIYDSDGNRKRTTIDYGCCYVGFSLPYVITEYAADAVTAVRSTWFDYNLSQQYIDRRIIGLVMWVHVRGTNGFESKTVYDYDNTSIDPQATSATQHDPAYSSSFTARANVTAVSRWDVTDIGNAAKAHFNQMTYDAAGSALTATDAAGHTSQLGYGEWFSDGNNSRNTFAYPTTATDADGNTSYAQYNFDFGAATHVQGPPPVGQTAGASQNMYFDDAGRLQWITRPDGFWHYFWYAPRGDAVVHQVSLTAAPESRWSITVVDGADRLRLNGAELPGSTGGYAGAFTIYDNMGRPVQQYNPAETNGWWQPVGDDAAGWNWTSQTYDWKGRPLVTTNQDNTTKYAEYGGCGCAGGEVVTLHDEMNRRQKIYSDSLGRQWKTEVLNWDGSVYSTTTNTFNARDQVTQVRQTDNTTGTYQDTTMSFDAYGRLQSKHVPEQNAGTATTYSYYDDDTIHVVTDARGASATYGYNNRHLITSINYSAPSGITPTPNVTFGYDAAGNRTSMTDGLGSKSYAYNSLSQLMSETRYFSPLGQYFTLSYDYNLSGELKKITDSTGMTINYGYDNTGRLTGVTGSDVIVGGVSTYASAFQYRAWGGLKQVSIGNHTTTLSYNSRLQESNFNITGVVVNENYDYFADGRLSFAHKTTDNNFDRSFSYDHAGRLTAAASGGEARHDSGVVPMNETFQYNAWDDITFRSSESWLNDFYDSATYTNHRRPEWSYDASGSVTAIDTRSYSYDAAGRTISLTGQRWTQAGYAPTSTTSDFDGDGNRIREISNSTGLQSTTYYLWSSVLGSIAEELSSGGVKQLGYVFTPAGGLLATQVPGANYVMLKQLSPTGATQHEFFTSNTANGSDIRREFDPAGATVPLQSHNFGHSGGPGDITTDMGGPADSRFSAMENPAAGCTLDGVWVPCSMAGRLLGQGSAVPCPNNDCSPRRVDIDVRFVGGETLHQAFLTDPFAAYADGSSGFNWHTGAGDFLLPEDFHVTFSGDQVSAAVNGFLLDSLAFYLQRPQGKKRRGRRRAPLGGVASAGIAGDSPFNHITIEGFSEDRTSQIKTELGKMFSSPCAEAFHAAQLKSPEEAIMQSGLQIRDSEFLKEHTAAELGIKEVDRLADITHFNQDRPQGITLSATDTVNGKIQIYLMYNAWAGESSAFGTLSFYEVMRHEMIHGVGAPNKYASFWQRLFGGFKMRHDLAGHDYYNKIMAACH